MTNTQMDHVEQAADGRWYVILRGSAPLGPYWFRADAVAALARIEAATRAAA